jgi:hypothetical protein
VYSPEGLVARHIDTNKRELYFVPSVYYNLPKQLVFQYDGIRFCKKEGRSFILRMEEAYPKTVTYMDQKITIRSVRYQDGSLRLSMDVPDPDILEIQGLNIEGSKETGYSMATLDEYTKGGYTIECYIEIDKREEYEVTLGYPGYLLKEPGQIEIELR